MFIEESCEAAVGVGIGHFKGVGFRGAMYVDVDVFGS
jgi:hypothetical protein